MKVRQIVGFHVEQTAQLIWLAGPNTWPPCTLKTSTNQRLHFALTLIKYWTQIFDMGENFKYRDHVMCNMYSRLFI